MRRALPLVVALGLIALGCSSRPEVVVSTLDAAHRGWDTLHVEVTFTRQAFLSDDEPVQPLEHTLVVFDAAYDTLYAGSSFRISVPDAELGDRERLVVEVCGTFPHQTVCEQTSIAASPKRLHLNPDVAYPGEPLHHGWLRLSPHVERQRFDDDTWESITRRRPLHGRLLVYLASEREQPPIVVPLVADSIPFDLRRHPHFDAFETATTAAMKREDSLRVHFDVFAGLDAADVQKKASIVRTIFVDTRKERTRQVRRFTEEASLRILRHLSTTWDRRSTAAYVDRWSYNETSATYVIAMEITWKQGGFFGSRHSLKGVLEVRSDGTGARFQHTNGDPRTERRWRRRIGRAELDLAQLAGRPSSPPPRGERSRPTGW